MQAFIKDNRLIVNNMILDDEKDKLLDFIEKAETKQVSAATLYNIEGEKAGVAFETGKDFEELDITPSEEEQSYEGLYNKVEVSAIQTEEVTPELNFNNKDNIIVEPEEGKYIKKVTLNKDDNLVPTNIKLGVTIDGVEGNLEPDKPDQDKSVDPSNEVQVVRADTGYELASVTVNAVPTQDKFANPTTNRQIIEPDEDKFLSSVIVNAVTSNIDSNITSENIKAGVNILGVEGDMNIVNTATNARGAIPEYIVDNSVAFVNGQQLVGNMPSLSGAQNNWLVADVNNTIVSDAMAALRFEAKSPDYYGYLKPNVNIRLWANKLDIANVENITSDKIKAGETIFNINGDTNIVNTADANAVAKNIMYGKTAYVNGQKLVGSLGTMGSASLYIDTPNIKIVNDILKMSKKLEGSSGANYYYSDQSMITSITSISNIANVCNVTSDKIVSGANILGIEGDTNIVNTADANAVAKNIMYGKTAYVGGQQLVGSLGTMGSASLYIDTPNIKIENDILKMSKKLEGSSGANYYYSDQSMITSITSISNIANVCNVTSDKIAYGENILGVEGTHTEILPSGLVFRSSSIKELPEWVNRLNTDEISSMGDMFYGCSKLKNVPNWNTSNATGFDNTFRECSNLTSVPNFDTSNTWTFRSTFHGCTNLISAPNWDMHNAEQASYMFSNCINLTSVPDYNMYKVYNLDYMFYNCRSLTNFPNILVSDNRIISIDSMFRNCTNLTEVPNFKFNDAKSVSSLFCDCINLTNIDVLNLSSTPGASWIFVNCYNLTSINELNLSNATSLTWIFVNCYNLTSINSLILSKINDTSNMFTNCYNLVDVPQLDTSNFNYRWGFSNMFTNCNSLSNASLSNILNMCMNAVNYTGTKTLKTLNIINSDLLNNVVNLPEYQDFLNAGWTIN